MDATTWACVAPGGVRGRLLTAAEYGDLQAHGIAIVFNWETTAGRMLGGYSAGNTDAAIADQVARALGHPADRPVYFSCDFDAAPGDQAVIGSYLTRVAAVIGSDRTGVYGSYCDATWRPRPGDGLILVCRSPFSSPRQQHAACQPDPRPGGAKVVSRCVGRRLGKEWRWTMVMVALPR